jgi:Glucodextranase, domain B/Domain of unknown function (DUF4352)/zinc-ribbon domain
MAQRYCTNCGAELREDDRFCPNCGRPVHETAAVSTPEADVPVPPPPQQEAETQPLEQAEARPRQPWTTRQLVLGCLGVFFVVFVIGAFLSALAGNGGGNEAQQNKKSGGGKDTASKPELVVSSPSGSPTVTKVSIEVNGEVTPATSNVTVNGEGVTPADDGSFSTPFHLNVGENYIQITAEKGSEQADASRTVTRELPEKETAAQEAPKVQKNEQQPQAKEQPQAEQKPTPQAEYSVGQTAQVANVQWRVSDAYLTSQLRSNFGTQKRGRFVVVNFTFTNNRDEEVTLDPELHMVLKDRSGREFGTDVDSWEFMPTNLNIFLEPVNPGISKNGRVIYQVPPDAWGFTLRLDDVEFWEDKSAVFDLSGMPLRAYTYPP